MWIDSDRDYGPRAAAYLSVLGWLNLLSLNPGGILWIWPASRLRSKSNGHRKATAVILALHVGALAVAGLFVLLHPDRNAGLRIWGERVNLGIWFHLCAVGAFAVAFALPLAWLLAPGTRAAF